jgi:hypothetical protein
MSLLLLRLSDAGHGASRIAAISRHPKPSTNPDIDQLDLCPSFINPD